MDRFQNIDIMDNLKLVGGTVVGVAVVLVSTSCWCTQLLILVSSIIALRLYLAPKMKYCESTNRLDGRVVIVTGGNTGIGKVGIKMMDNI